MKTASRSNAVRVRPALLAGLFTASLATLAPAQTTAPAATPTLDNFVTVGGAGTLLKGDRAQFEKLTNQQKDGWGGIESFHYGRDLDQNTSLSADGRALLGNNDFRLDLKLTRENVGFLRVGFQQYRTWYDGTGGYFPPSDLSFALYGNELHIDRGDFWVEAGTTRPDQINFNFRYDYTFRRGLKDSTSWGDTNLTGGLGTRNVVPTFLRIREHRHIATAAVTRQTEQLNWQLNGRYEWQSMDNERAMRRQPYAASDRFVTQKDGADTDLFMIHGAFDTRIGPTLTLGAGVAHYDIDTTLRGSRIYGDFYDPVFNATMARRQQFDEGFLNLDGTTRMKQTLANLNLMYTPTETWTIVPELRAERNTWGGNAEYVDTAVGTAPALITSTEDMNSTSGRNYRNLTEVLEFRYSGFKDLALNASLEGGQGYGTLAEDLIAQETGVDTLYRTTDYRREDQKVELSAHWYPQPGLNFSAQYYWTGRQNAFSHTRDSTPPTGGDRYPAYITHQDRETNDANFRVTWSPLLQVRAVTRYDYQESKIRTQVQGLAFLESARVKTHILSETVTWNPLARWYVQASGNLVFDRTTTPAHDLVGTPPGLILNSDNNYFNGDITSGYALDDRTDVTVTYSYYRSNNYVNNSTVSLPYGASQRTQFVSATWSRRVSAMLNYTLRYAYGENRDQTSGYRTNFRAHTAYGTVQYRF